MDGVSLAYTFSDANAEPRKKTQFFDNNGSRGVYPERYFASTFGPFIPWNAADNSRLAAWDSAADVWQLYDLGADFTQSTDVSGEYPEKLAEMKALFLEVAEDNLDFPIGAGNWLRLHPEDIHKPPYDTWTFRESTRRMPEFTAPGLGRTSNRVVVELESGKRASGVLYALGGASGGLTLFMDDGYLVYEYNMMIIDNYQGKSTRRLPPGRHRIEIVTDIAGPGKPGVVELIVDGTEVARIELARTVPLAFTASETFDVGVDLGSPVSLRYESRRPFEFDGRIEHVEVSLTGPG